MKDHLLETKISDAGKSVMSSLIELRKSGVYAYQENVLYLLDEKFDVLVTVQLLPKKSQLEIGMNMFRGNSKKEKNV